MLTGSHLLIAEDNPTNQIVVAKIVEQLGATFDLASDGVEAIQMFDPQKHDLALLDIEMPKKSGLEVIRYIRERKDTPEHFPILALTAFVLAEHRAKILDAGADAILAKPIIDIDKFGEDIICHMNRSMAKAPTRTSGLTDLANSMGKEVMPELVESLISDLEVLKAQLQPPSDGASTSLDDLKSAAHKLSSLAKMAGDDQLALAAEAIEIESDAASSDLSSASVRAKSDELIEGVDALLGEIAEFEKEFS